MKQTSAKCAAAQQGPPDRGKAFPLGVPYGMACGQALQPCGLTGGLTTSSRLRRTRTPIWMKELKKDKETADKTVYSSCALPSAFTLPGFHLSFGEICSNKPSHFWQRHKVMPLRAHNPRSGELAHLKRLADFLGRQQFYRAVNLWRIGIGAAHAAFFAHAGR